jgi:ribosomal protein S18
LKNNNPNGPDEENELLLPINIFTNGTSGLESISKYLHDVLGLKYCAIAELLNRDDRTIWGAYNDALMKSDSEFDSQNESIGVPVSIFKDRSVSILEALSEYLKDELNLKYCRIAGLLNKNQRTVWTVYQRAKRKRRIYEKNN